MQYTWTIDQTWDGKLLGLAEHTYVSLNMVDGSLPRVELDAPYYGDPQPQGASGPLWGLWEYEVVELFLVAEDGTYLEIEVGPHGHYLILKLDGPRSIVDKMLVATVSTQIADDRWHATLQLSHDLLTDVPSKANAFAIHGEGVSRRYLAHSPVPGNKPDFHQPNIFPDLQSVPERA